MANIPNENQAIVEMQEALSNGDRDQFAIAREKYLMATGKRSGRNILTTNNGVPSRLESFLTNFSRGGYELARHTPEGIYNLAGAGWAGLRTLDDYKTDERQATLDKLAHRPVRERKRLGDDVSYKDKYARRYAHWKDSLAGRTMSGLTETLPSYEETLAGLRVATRPTDWHRMRQSYGENLDFVRQELGVNREINPMSSTLGGYGADVAALMSLKYPFSKAMARKSASTPGRVEHLDSIMKERGILGTGWKPIKKYGKKQQGPRQLEIKQPDVPLRGPGGSFPGYGGQSLSGVSRQLDAGVARRLKITPEQLLKRKNFVAKTVESGKLGKVDDPESAAALFEMFGRRWSPTIQGTMIRAGRGVEAGIEGATLSALHGEDPLATGAYMAGAQIGANTLVLPLATKLWDHKLATSAIIATTVMTAIATEMVGQDADWEEGFAWAAEHVGYFAAAGFVAGMAGMSRSSAEFRMYSPLAADALTLLGRTSVIDGIEQMVKGPAREREEVVQIMDTIKNYPQKVPKEYLVVMGEALASEGGYKAMRERIKYLRKNDPQFREVFFPQQHKQVGKGNKMPKTNNNRSKPNE